MDSDAQKRRAREGHSHRARTFRFRSLLQSTGWISPVYVAVDDRGIIAQISTEQPVEGGKVEEVDGHALPGFQNAHSHAFQYAMAGMAEKHAVNAVDDFWSWREAMYARALALNPDQMQAVATMLYAEMLKNGYTHVAEFQYVHRDENGKPYDNRAEMSVSLIAAAAIAGIKITLIPVFYQKGGFGKAATPAQRRFCFGDVGQYFRLLDDCALVVKELSTARLGFGVHSLRAAEAGDVVRIVTEGPTDLPFHMHLAEQLREVEESLLFLAQRPAEWLLNHAPLSDRFHLVHCTHLTDSELARLGGTKANVVLCPSTEANLGDGIFRLTDFAQRSRHWSIGTDSQIGLNPLEDLRWLDYGQRLSTHRRNTFSDGGSTLIESSFFAGRRAMGIVSQDYFEVGRPFDAVVYRNDHPLLSTAGPEQMLPILLYASPGASLAGTIVDGEWIAEAGRHKHEESITENFRKAMRKLAL